MCTWCGHLTHLSVTLPGVRSGLSPRSRRLAVLQTRRLASLLPETALPSRKSFTHQCGFGIPGWLCVPATNSPAARTEINEKNLEDVVCPRLCGQFFTKAEKLCRAPTLQSQQLCIQLVQLLTGSTFYIFLSNLMCQTLKKKKKKKKKSLASTL